jgi:hypothetical protein
VVKTGVVIGPHPMARFYKPCHGRATLHAAEGEELKAAYLLQKMGCSEVILFACPFNLAKENEVLRARLIREFCRMNVPVYQTLVASPIRLPAVDILEFI